MKNSVAIAASLIFGLASAAPMFPQAVSASFSSPLVTSGLTALLSGESVDFGAAGRADRYDLWFPVGSAGPFSLTQAEAAYGPFWLGAAVLGLPAFDLGIQVPGFAIPAVAEGLRLGSQPWSASIYMANAFIPRLQTSVSGSSVLLESEPAFCVAGDIAYRGLSLRLLWAEDTGAMDLGFGTNMSKVGGFSGSLALASIGFGDFGAVVGYLSSEASVTIKSWLGSLFNVPWLSFSGNFDSGFVAAWGSLVLGGPRLEARLDAAAGLLWSLDSSAEEASGKGATTTYTSSWLFGSSTPGIIIIHPSIRWRPSAKLHVNLGRWLPYYWGWSLEQSWTSSGASGSLSIGPAGTASITGNLDLGTILFSGLEVSCDYFL